MAITLSHGGPTIHRSPAPSRHVLVGTIEGVVCIERDSGGPGWHVAHRALTDKHIHALLIEPESGTIFAGANHGSIFASADGGHSWERRDEGLTQHNIYSLECVRRAGGVRIFAGTEPAHLYYSDDLGRRWTELVALRSVDMSGWGFPAPPNIAHTKHIAFHPEDPDTLFIGVEQGGLLKSTDAGHTFQVVPGMDDDVHRTVIDPLNADQMYITTGIGIYVERRRRQDVGATDRPPARDRRLSRSPGAASETAGAAVRRVGRERSRSLASQPLRGLPHLQEHGRREDLGDLAPRVARPPAARLRGDVSGGLGDIVLALRRDGDGRGVVQR
jgi:hypothetical protein